MPLGRCETCVLCIININKGRFHAMCPVRHMTIAHISSTNGKYLDTVLTTVSSCSDKREHYYSDEI